VEHPLGVINGDLQVGKKIKINFTYPPSLEDKVEKLYGYFFPYNYLKRS